MVQQLKLFLNNGECKKKIRTIFLKNTLTRYFFDIKKLDNNLVKSAYKSFSANV